MLLKLFASFLGVEDGKVDRLLCVNAAEREHVSGRSSGVSSDPGARWLRGRRVQTYPGCPSWTARRRRAGTRQYVLWGVWTSRPRGPASPVWRLWSWVSVTTFTYADSMVLQIALLFSLSILKFAIATAAAYNDYVIVLLLLASIGHLSCPVDGRLSP